MPTTKVTSILVCLSLLLLSNTCFSQGDRFIGQDQQVNRIIKLKSTKTVPQSVTPAPNTSRAATEARKTATVYDSPPQIRYDDIDVPRALSPKPVVNTQSDFSAPPKPVVSSPTSSFQKRSKAWQYPNRPAVTPNVKTRTAAKSKTNTKTNNQLKRSGSNMIETVLITPKSVNLNQQAQVLIELHNRGKENVENISLFATIPSHVTLGSSTPAPTSSEGQVYEFTIPRIGGSGSRSVSLNLTPTAKQPFGLTTRVRVENSIQSTVSVQQPELSLAISGPQQANIGQKVHHELIVANIGDGVATDVRLDTVLPQQIKLINQKGDSFIPSIAPGKSVRIKYETLALAPGEVQLKVAADSTGCEQKNSAISLNVYQPQLRVSAVGPKLNYVQRDGIYTIDVENTGVVDVTDAKISLQIPQGMKVTTISRHADVDPKDGILTWTFNRVKANSIEKIQLKATAVEPGEQVCKMLVTSNETVQKEMLLTTKVVTRADLSVRIKNLTGPVQIGAKAQFLVTVENVGSQRANDINVQVVLPESLMAVKNENSDAVDSTLNFAEPLVSAGQKVTFKFEAVGVAHGEHVVRSILKTEESARQLIAEDTIFVYQVDETRVSESTTPVVPR